MKPLIPLAIVAVLAVSLSACGSGEIEEQREGAYQSINAQVAETEAVYLDIEELKYQVQASRQLNPLLIDDKAYLDGLSEEDKQLADDEVWFGIWMRVENHTDEPLPNAIDFEIEDTQENIYRPLEFGPGNPFVYRGADIGSDEVYPSRNEGAGERQPYGSLLLFKVKRFSIDNRPLELRIRGREGQEAFVNLDV